METMYLKFNDALVVHLKHSSIFFCSAAFQKASSRISSWKDDKYNRMNQVEGWRKST